MKNIILLCILMLAFLGCSDNEEFTPTNTERNLFDLPDFSSEQEMEIRRNFHASTGVYLLFNDSLGWREVTTPQGTYTTCDILDLNYNITSKILHSFEFTYLKDIEEKKQAVNFLENEVLSMLPTSFYPQAILLVDDFLFSEYVFFLGLQPAKITGAYPTYHATVVGCNGVLQMNESDRYSYKREILKGILMKSYALLEDKEYTDFYQYSDAYYGSYNPYNEEVMELGFLNVYNRFFYYEKENDIIGFIMETFSMTEKEFEEKYAAWPIVLQKQKALVKILERNGITVY